MFESSPIPVVSFTIVGTTQFTFVPVPHCPFEFSPYAYTFRSFVINSVCPVPSTTFTTFDTPSSSFSVSRFTTFPLDVIA